MNTLLMSFHVLLLLHNLNLRSRRNVNKIFNLTIPVSIAFVYSVVVQGIGAINRPSYVINEENVFDALSISLVAHATFTLIFWVIVRCNRRIAYRYRWRPILVYATILFFISFGTKMYLILSSGIYKYYFVRNVLEAIQSTYSAYIYNLPVFLFSSLTLFVFAWVNGKISNRVKYILSLVMVLNLFEAVQLTDRSDLVRSGLILMPILLFGNARGGAIFQNWSCRSKITKFALFSFFVLLPIMVVLAPQFREAGERSFFSSNVDITRALSNTVTGGGFDSRYSDDFGGEFDTAVRLVKAINSELLTPAGGTHLAFTAWGFVPRFLVPDKHLLFDQWAGESHLQIEQCRSYPGCTLTGWGEAYAQFGAFHFVYWTILAMIFAWLQSCFPDRIEALLVFCCCFIPFSQLIMMGFWAGFMNILYGVIPFLLVVFIYRSSVTRMS